MRGMAGAHPACKAAVDQPFQESAAPEDVVTSGRQVTHPAAGGHAAVDLAEPRAICLSALQPAEGEDPAFLPLHCLA